MEIHIVKLKYNRKNNKKNQKAEEITLLIDMIDETLNYLFVFTSVVIGPRPGNHRC